MNNDNAIERIEKNGFELAIFYDQSPESPRNWDNLGKIYTNNNNRYMKAECTKYEVDNAVVKLPVYCYNHSGIKLNTTGFNCLFDSGLFGYIIATKEDIKRCMGNNACIDNELKEKIAECLRQEIEALSQYFEGDVYGYTITRISNGEFLDSCYGFYDMDRVLSEGRSALESLIQCEDSKNFPLFQYANLPIPEYC